MNYAESVWIALSSLRANKLRTILTLLGVIIGVTTVITVVSIIQGMNNYVVNTISQAGADNFRIDKYGIITSFEEFLEAIRRKEITFDDMEAVREHCNLCDEVGAFSMVPSPTPVGTRRSPRIKRGNQYIKDINVFGGTANYPYIINRELTAGRYFTEQEERHGAAIAVIGYEVANNLFPNVDPLGKTIKIDQKDFRVTGLVKKMGSFLGQNLDSFVEIPMSTFRRMYGTHESVFIVAKVLRQEDMLPAQDQARIILRAKRHVKYKDPDDFAILTSDTFIELWKNFSAGAFAAMVGVSAISLVVGGIVIMNIMLVSVIERTNEIGVRKSLGARRRDILWQFLTESVTLAAVGGAIGIGLGVIIAKIISATTPMPSSVEIWSVILGLAIASSVGLFFGIYPAMKASRLDPIEALRTD